MGYEDARHDDDVECPICDNWVERQYTRLICGECMSDIEQVMEPPRTVWGRLCSALGCSYGFRTSVALLMAIAWLAVMLMESFV